jgi:hypothetical protein
LILEQLAREPAKLKNYVKPPEKSKTVLPVVEREADTMTDEEKAVVIERNVQANELAARENERLELEYNNALAAYKKIEQVISTLKVKSGCMCGSCIDLNITNTAIPIELEGIIDAARKEAEEKTY